MWVVELDLPPLGTAALGGLGQVARTLGQERQRALDTLQARTLQTRVQTGPHLARPWRSVVVVMTASHCNNEHMRPANGNNPPIPQFLHRGRGII